MSEFEKLRWCWDSEGRYLGVVLQVSIVDEGSWLG